MGILSFLGSLGCGKKSITESESFDFHPFTILRHHRTEKYFNMNYGKRVARDYSTYQILYRGKPVTFPHSLEQNTGYQALWKTWVLKEGDQPLILAGSQSMFLIKEEEGEAKVTSLSAQTSSFASIQWLDLPGNTIGPKKELYISDDRDSSIHFIGGQYLLINEGVVLNISDLSTYTLNKFSALCLDYYPTQTVAFSPDESQVVFIANKYKDKYIYSLNVYKFRENTAYTVPFDQTETRMQDEWDADNFWFDRYFYWDTNPEGDMQLKKREFEIRPAWEGRLKDNDSFYHLHPVKVEMAEALKKFLLNKYSLKENDFIPASQASQNDFRVQIEGSTYLIYASPERKEVHFLRDAYLSDQSGINSLVKEVGESFNNLLREGMYQEYFTSF